MSVDIEQCKLISKILQQPIVRNEGHHPRYDYSLLNAMCKAKDDAIKMFPALVAELIAEREKNLELEKNAAGFKIFLDEENNLASIFYKSGEDVFEKRAILPGPDDADLLRTIIEALMHLAPNDYGTSEEHADLLRDYLEVITGEEDYSGMFIARVKCD